MPKEKSDKKFNRSELIWKGKYDEKGNIHHTDKIALPFQVVETLNEPRRASLGLDFGEKKDENWRNKLIWGDNQLVMAALSKGDKSIGLEPLAGKINLIYIDPPFAVGADFSARIKVGDEEIVKEPSFLEQKAYRDTWGEGLDSYLQMMYDRLVLMRDLLAEDGSIYVHLDWHVAHYVKLILDEIFGKENFRNEIVWKRLTYKQTQVTGYGVLHDVILYYTKGRDFVWTGERVEYSDDQLRKYFSWVETLGGRNIKLSKEQLEDSQKLPEGRRFALNPVINVNPNRPRLRYEFLGFTRTWKYTKEKMQKYYKEGVVFQPSPDSLPQKKQYLDESKGMKLNDLWFDISAVMGGSDEYLPFDTQKPEALLERIIKVSSNEGDFVADFFCGSGTTMAVAQRLGRRWIGCDLSKFAIHTSRKRLMQIPDCTFEILNLGKYERQHWQTSKLNHSEEKEAEKIKKYLKFIVELYRAEWLNGFRYLHGKKGNRMVHVGAIDAPVTLDEVANAVEEVKANGMKNLDILGWDWSYEVNTMAKNEAKEKGTELRLLQIPREVMEPEAVRKGDIEFFELAVVEVEAKKEGKDVKVELKSFISPNDELLPEDVRDKIKNWSDWIDYWAVDFEFNTKPEKSLEDDTFHNMWQSYRTRKNPRLSLVSAPHTYPKPGKYNILVKVVDIFGNDTTKLVEVKIQ